jgi:glycosyltransferase involved in cell wall biosynthesis
MVITTVHDPIPHNSKKFIIIRINKKAIKESDAVIVLSKKFINYMKNKYNMKDNIYYIPLGNHHYINENDTIEKQKRIISYPVDKINFLFFGQIAEYKGLDVLLKAYKQTKEMNYNVTLTVIGSGDIRQYVPTMSGLKDFSLVNRWIEPEEISSCFDGQNIVMVCPYLTATQSGVIPLAMYHRSLVIATRTGGLTEQVCEDETGILVEPNSVADLARSMLDVAVNYKKYIKVLDNAQKYVNSLNWNNLSQRINDIIIDYFRNKDK